MKMYLSTASLYFHWSYVWAWHIRLFTGWTIKLKHGGVFLVAFKKWLVQCAPVQYRTLVTFYKVPENTDMFNWSTCIYLHRREVSLQDLEGHPEPGALNLQPLSLLRRQFSTKYKYFLLLPVKMNQNILSSCGIPSFVEYTAFVISRKIRNFQGENSQLFETLEGYFHNTCLSCMEEKRK